MTTQDDFYDDDGPGIAGRLMRWAIPTLIFVSLAWGIFYLITSTNGVHREAPRLQTILATLPPPPPPPPKVERPPEPEKKLEVPKPNEVKPTDAPRPVTINGPAQSGNDAFNIAAGDGGGSIGSSNGLGEATYSRYMGSSIQQLIQQDDRVNRLVFTAEVAVWIDERGRLTRARILRSTGDSDTDGALLAALQEMPSLDQAPPSTLAFPQRVSIRGKRLGAG